MADFSVYKALKLSEIQSNGNLSTTTLNTTTIVTTGATNVISQSCTRENYFRVANAQATTTEAGSLEGRVASYQQFVRTANFTSLTANTTANTTNYSVVNIWKHPAANAGGTTAVLVATANLYNVSMTQWVPYPLTISTGVTSNVANAYLAPGDVITCNITATGTGVGTTSAMIDYCAEDF